MAESKIEKINGQYHPLPTKRFDRENNIRIHFASAMTIPWILNWRKASVNIFA